MTSVYAGPTGRWGFGDVGWCVLVFIGVVLVSALLFTPVRELVPEAFTTTGFDASTLVGAWLVVLAQAFTVTGMAAPVTATASVPSKALRDLRVLPAFLSQLRAANPQIPDHAPISLRLTGLSGMTGAVGHNSSGSP